MNRRRALSLLVATVTVLSLAVGSASFTAVEADRGVSVNVVPDSEAYVGYNSSDVGPVEQGDEIDLVKLSNRFSENTTLNVTSVDISTNTEMDIEPIDPYPTLSSGDSTKLNGTVENCVPGTTNVEVTVELDGGSVWAKIFGDYYTREFTVTCEEPTVDGVTHTGNAWINISATNLDTVNVKALTVSNAGQTTSHNITEIDGLETNTDLHRNNDLGASGNEKFVALQIEETGQTFVRDQYNVTTGVLHDSGNYPQVWNLNNSFNWSDY
jgi:hypothetical protein